MRIIKNYFHLSVLACLLICLSASVSWAQTTAFSYQGRLIEAGSPANGNYLMQFKLFDAAGTQTGTTLTDVAVSVTNGVFNVTLDFGSAVFTGENRFLEVSIKKLQCRSDVGFTERRSGECFG